MKNNKSLNLDAFKLSVKQDNKKVESLMGGAALANCHPTKATYGCKDTDKYSSTSVSQVTSR